MNIALLQRDRVRWLTAAPLWDRASAAPGAGGRMGEPVILRFEGDDFMEQAQRTLAARPADMARYVARAESWREITAGWQDVTESEPITLYQPMHNRFYLATATLVCQRPGLPDRTLNRVGGDVAAMLLRRLAPRGAAPVNPANPATFVEQGWIGTAQTGRWVTLDSPDLPGIGEERLPLFPLPYREGDRTRCLHGAVIPVARAGGYDTSLRAAESRASAADSVGDRLGDPRASALRQGVLVGLQTLADRADAPGVPADVLDDYRTQTRAALVFALLDLGEFLTREAPRVMTALRTGATGGLNSSEQTLYDRLNGTALQGGHTTRTAIVRAVDRAHLLQSGTPSATLMATILGTSPEPGAIQTFASDILLSGADLADLIFVDLGNPQQVLADRRVALLRDAAAPAADRITAEAEFGDDATTRDALLRELLDLDALLARELPDVAAALPDGPLPATADSAIFNAFGATLAPGITWGAALTDARTHAADLLAATPTRSRLPLTAAQATGAAPAFFAGIAAAAAPSAAARPLPSATPPAVAAAETPVPIYALRTLYERPACAGIHPPTISARSRAFRLASFYDADAPVRPLKIEMPVRTSIADLRSAPKSVSIQLSKELRKQMGRLREAQLSDPLDEQMGGEGRFDFGVICTLSIPIITICALLLLMILVQLLNIVFWWLPYFMICFPVKK